MWGKLQQLCVFFSKFVRSLAILLFIGFLGHTITVPYSGSSPDEELLLPLVYKEQACICCSCFAPFSDMAALTSAAIQIHFCIADLNAFWTNLLCAERTFRQAASRLWLEQLEYQYRPCALLLKLNWRINLLAGACWQPRWEVVLCTGGWVGLEALCCILFGFPYLSLYPSWNFPNQG